MWIGWPFHWHSNDVILILTLCEYKISQLKPLLALIHIILTVDNSKWQQFSSFPFRTSTLFVIFFFYCLRIAHKAGGRRKKWKTKKALSTSQVNCWVKDSEILLGGKKAQKRFFKISWPISSFLIHLHSASPYPMSLLGHFWSHGACCHAPMISALAQRQDINHQLSTVNPFSKAGVSNFFKRQAHLNCWDYR